jgi:adenylate cyclase
VINRDGDVYGSTVNIAARVATRAGASDVLVTETVKSRLDGGRLELVSLGTAELKGVNSPIELYRVVVIDQG